MLITLDDVCRTVGLVLGHRSPAADDLLQEDLGAESIDVLNIVATLEEKHGVSIDESAMSAVRTVRDLHQLLVSSPNVPLGSADPRRTA